MKEEEKEKDEEELEEKEKLFWLNFFSSFYKWTYLMLGFCSMTICNQVVISIFYEL